MIDRRNLLLGVSALAGLGAPAPSGGQTAVTLDELVRVSSRLVGAGVDRAIAARLLEGLRASGRAETLASLVAGADDRSGAAGELANGIVAFWYCGVLETGHGPEVATYDQAMLWRALSFTKPSGSCGGAIGYWSEPG